jgi:hypothetical protein
MLKIKSKILTSYMNGLDTIKSSGILNYAGEIEFYDTAPIKTTVVGKNREIFEKVWSLKKLRWVFSVYL